MARAHQQLGVLWQGDPYLPVLDLLKGYCGIDSRDDLRRRREKVVGKVLGLDEALRRRCPPSWRSWRCRWTSRSGRPSIPQRRQRTLDAIKRLLLRESQVQPLLVVFEDLHWIDTETQALLDSLVESLPTAQLLFWSTTARSISTAGAARPITRNCGSIPCPR